MELQTGMPLLKQQFAALLKKNALLAWRNKWATIMQIMASFLFLLLIFSIDALMESRRKSSVGKSDVKEPKAFSPGPIPACEDTLLVITPCWDFVWSGPKDNERIRGIVDAIRDNNPGRPIPFEKVKYFKTTGAADRWLFGNQLRTTGALHFEEENSTVISYGIQTNSTLAAALATPDDPTFTYRIPLQVAAEREIARSLIGDPDFNWVVNLKKFAHPGGDEQISPSIILSPIGPIVFMAIAMFGFVSQMSSLVQEKELKLRQAMSIMGLYDAAYWFSWLTWETVMSALSSILTVLFGKMFRFESFTKNNMGVFFLLLFFFQTSMMGLAFMLSTFLSKSSSANTIGFFIFIISFITQIVTFSAPIYTPVVNYWLRHLWSLFPPNLLARGVLLLDKAIVYPDPSNPLKKSAGMNWGNLEMCENADLQCTMTMKGVYIWFASTIVIWFILAIYFDNVLPNSSGVRKSVFYFLDIGYWTGRSGGIMEGAGLFSLEGFIPRLEPITPDDDDVLEEENYVKQQTRDGEVAPNIAVQIQGLVKSYPGKFLKKGAKSLPFHAVKGLWINMAKDQLFCLLGPNGAGKTTTISCLTGVTPVTSGDGMARCFAFIYILIHFHPGHESGGQCFHFFAFQKLFAALIYGNSVQSSVGMTQIRKLIGVCPQFDILWDSLSGLEHIHLFGRLKGLHPSTLGQIAKKALAEVKLTGSARTRSGSYSGGMKRRLSVAIALLGDPKLVILDEPTTGMDPITRRHVWDIIEKAKKGRAIILTTHSMEEADILSDRIGIMAKGRLRCLGTSIRLKSKFGTGFVATVRFAGIPEQTASDENATNTRAKSVKEFFNHHLNVKEKEETTGYLTFVIPRQKEALLKVVLLNLTTLQLFLEHLET
uniref:ABC transporter domain-containing protein n=1 Tax=Kalanchoe fedtschenkoi TaxID=63787 RepID=A0A7N0VH21_KALFE